MVFSLSRLEDSIFFSKNLTSWTSSNRGHFLSMRGCLDALRRTIVGSTVRFNAAALVAFDSGDESLACTEIWSCHGHQEGAFFLHSKNGGLGGGFKIFLFSPLPRQSDPIWRIEFCTWVGLVQPPTSCDFSKWSLSSLSCQPERDSLGKGFTFLGWIFLVTFWWRRSLVRELWRHHLLKSCWFCCSYIPLQYTCQIFTICDIFVRPCMRFSIHRSIAIPPAFLSIIVRCQGFSLQFNSVVPCCTSQPVIRALRSIMEPTHRWLPSQPQLLDWQRQQCGNFSEKAPFRWQNKWNPGVTKLSEFFQLVSATIWRKWEKRIEVLLFF